MGCRKERSEGRRAEANFNKEAAILSQSPSRAVGYSVISNSAQPGRVAG